MGAENLDGRADLYSLGLMLEELLLGKRPFRDLQVDANWSAMIDEMIRIRKQGVLEVDDSENSQNISSGILRVLRKCLHPNPAMRWQSGKELAVQLELCQQPTAQQILYPERKSVFFKLRSQAFWLIFLSAAVPNIALGIFNYLYNVRAVMADLGEKQQEFTSGVVFVINLIAYPLGFALVGYLTWTVTRTSSHFQKKADFEPADDVIMVKLRKRCLNLGHFIAILGIVEWSIAGIAYPVTINVLAGSMGLGSYLHFFGSLVLCGLIVASYPFFLGTCIGLRVIYPCLAPVMHFEKEDVKSLQKVKSRSSSYLVIAALVPMLSVLGIVLVSIVQQRETQTGRFALLVLGGVGVGGFYVIYRLYRRLQNDLDALIGFLEPHT